MNEMLLEKYDQNNVTHEKFERVKTMIDGYDLTVENVARASEAFLPIRIWIVSAI